MARINDPEKLENAAVKMNAAKSRLEKYLSEKLGYPVYFSITVEESRYGRDASKKISIFSNELKSYAGITAPLYKSLMLSDFGVVLFDDDEMHQTIVGFALHFSFEYESGGSNGTSLVEVRYNVDIDKFMVGEFGKNTISNYRFI